MILFNPKRHARQYRDEKSRQIMLQTISFFEDRGLRKLKEDWHQREWNSDFVAFMKENKILATLLTPAGYGDDDCRWDTYRNNEFSEITGFYGLTYWYTWQVTKLGLGPIWMGDNEEAKRKTAELLREGHVFAFGLSEKEHGADIYSSDMMLTPQQNGAYRADGDKYYIGNGNEAALVSTFARMSDSNDYVFFVVESKHPSYECIQNVVAQQNYVAEFALHSYPVSESDILKKGPHAWDDMLNTINLCKVNLGWCAIGLCTHAYYEAIDHAANRKVYGKFVTDFPHVKKLMTEAYCRLVGMKLFCERAGDYMRAANANDRRYLLYNPMMKMKVTREGEEVMHILHDVIAAKGFEKGPFFEIAKNEIAMLPKLEGTVHVNMALIVKFMENYFFNPKDYSEVSRQDQPVNDEYLFHQGPTRGLGTIQFHDYNIAYDSCTLPNVEVFKRQIKMFKKLLVQASPSSEQTRDIDYLLALGEILTLVAYGQLILESRKFFTVPDDLLDEMFDVFVRDFSSYALNIYTKPSSTDRQREMALAMIHHPVADAARFQQVWVHHVYAMKDQYMMHD